MALRSLLLIVGLLLCGNAFAESQPPSPRPFESSQNKQSHTNNSYQQPADNQRGTENHPLFRKSSESEKSPEHTEQDRQERNEKATNERSLVTWTIVMSCATIALALITGALAFFTFGLWKETKVTSDRQAKELRKIERAFVYLEGFDQEMAGTGEDTRLTLRPLWRNSGNTPTLDMHVWVNWCLNKGMLSIGFPYDFKSSYGQRFFLAPKAIEGSEFIEIPANDVDEAIQASSEGGEGTKKQIYIWGMVTYYDIFGQKQHFTKFCYRVDFGAAEGKHIRARFVQWGSNNRTDNTPDEYQEFNH